MEFTKIKRTRTTTIARRCVRQKVNNLFRNLIEDINRTFICYHRSPRMDTISEIWLEVRNELHFELIEFECYPSFNVLESKWGKNCAVEE